MPYKVIPIGTDFNTKALKVLEDQLSAEEGGGWEVVTVFPVVRTTCLFLKQESNLVLLHRRSEPSGN